MPVTRLLVSFPCDSQIVTQSLVDNGILHMACRAQGSTGMHALVPAFFSMLTHCNLSTCRPGETKQQGTVLHVPDSLCM